MSGNVLPFFLHSGSEQFNGSDEANGSKAHQLSPSEDDDHTQNWPEVQGRLPRALLQVCFSLDWSECIDKAVHIDYEEYQKHHLHESAVNKIQIVL